MKERHAADDDAFRRSAGSAAVRGALLLLVAVVIGIVLLQSTDGNASNPPVVAGARATTTTTSKPAAGKTGTTSTTVALKAPQQIKVLVANGTAVKGLAGKYQKSLAAAGYNALTPTDTVQKPVSRSAVYASPSLTREAAVLASLLSIPAAQVKSLTQAPPLREAARSADVIVVIGADKSNVTPPTIRTTSTTSARGTTSTTKKPWSAPALLVPFLDAPDRAAVLSDFDGTLAPIVDDPDRAVPLPGVVDALGELARRYQVVGVISGRPVAYLLDALGPAPRLVGLYGLERVEHGRGRGPPRGRTLASGRRRRGGAGRGRRPRRRARRAQGVRRHVPLPHRAGPGGGGGGVGSGRGRTHRARGANGAQVLRARAADRARQRIGGGRAGGRQRRGLLLRRRRGRHRRLRRPRPVGRTRRALPTCGGTQ